MFSIYGIRDTPLFFVSEIGVMFKYLITLMFWFVFSMSLETIMMFFSLSYCNNIHVNGLLLNFVLGGLNSIEQIYIENYSIDKMMFTYFL